MNISDLDVASLVARLTRHTTVVVFQESCGDYTAWVAQSREIDQAAQGDSREEALSAWRRCYLATCGLHVSRAYAEPRPCPDDVWADLTARPGARQVVFSFSHSETAPIGN